MYELCEWKDGALQMNLIHIYVNWKLLTDLTQIVYQYLVG